MGGIFAFFPIVIDFALALAWPMAKMKEMAAGKAGVNSVNQISELPELEANLMKLIEMKERV